MKRIVLLLLISLAVTIAHAQSDIRIYPTHWWVGMKNPNLQLMVHGKDIANRIPNTKLPGSGTRVADGMILKAVHHTENPNYVFLDLVIARNANPGNVKMDFV